MKRPAAATAAAITALGIAACSPSPPNSTRSAAHASVITAAPIVTAPPPSALNRALAEAREFVFRVRNGTCLTTGTAFAYEGTIVTNRHVAAGATSLSLATWYGQDFTASVEGHSTSTDLALLSAPDPSGTVQPPAAPEQPSVGTTVFVTGYPQGNQLTVTAGRVLGFTSVSDLGVPGPVLEVSDRVRPGNSGSPLLDSAGRLLGVVFALDTRTGDGLAIPVHTLGAYLSGGSDTSTLPCVH